MRELDLVVIGSGPAGQKAAIQAAKLKKKVVVVERENVVGGACANTGTLPSKTLKDAIFYLHGFKRRSFPHITYSLRQRFSFSDLMARKEMVVRHEVEVLTHQLDRNNVEVLRGSGALVDSHTVRVTHPNGAVEDLKAQFIVIATGSSPRRPAEIPFNDVSICDSDSILSTEAIPKRVVVMGGGVIGCEYASMFAAFGIKVTLLDRRSHLLRFIDHEIAQNLLFHMRANGVTLWLGEEPARVAVEDNVVVTELKSGKRVESDVLLYAMGRTPNTAGLNLEGVGITVDKQGQIPVNAHFQTVLPHIYAAGDVIGFPALASTSMEQGRVASAHAFGLDKAVMTPTWPYGIYTVPEVSTVGKGEEELTEAKVPYEVGRAFFKEIAKGQIVGDLDGLLKLIFHRQTHELLGVHIIGEGATELVHIGQVVMGFKGNVDFFVSNVFNYPTLAECYRVAALDGLNRLGKARTATSSRHLAEVTAK